MRTRRRHPVLAILVIIIVCLGVLLTIPWAFHIGGRWTPLLTWRGSGKLLTKGGIEYPLWVCFYPSAHQSSRVLDGRRATAGVQGLACLCMSPGVTQALELEGTIYGGWRSTEGSLMEFRMHEPKVFDVGQGAGFFDLYGRWRGPELVMDDRGEPGNTFRSGLRIEHASVTLDWSRFWTCKAACASAANEPAHR